MLAGTFSERSRNALGDQLWPLSDIRNSVANKNVFASWWAAFEYEFELEILLANLVSNAWIVEYLIWFMNI